MDNPIKTQIDEEDADILALRAAALNSLTKETRKDSHIERNITNYRTDFSHLMVDEQRSNLNGIPSTNYGGHPRPSFPNQPPIPVFHQNMYNHQQMYPQHRVMSRPNFHPRQPAFVPQQIMPSSVQPHLNPHFMPQNAMQYVPEDLGGLHHNTPNEELSMLQEHNGFIPTPPTRLSPRSAQFVAENNEALRRSRRRSPSISAGRSRSRSPYNRNYTSSSRSRSPHYRNHNSPRISHIARKRTNSKSPEQVYLKKVFRKARSPRRQRSVSPEKNNSENKRIRGNKNGNGYGRPHNNKINDRKTQTPPKTVTVGKEKDKTLNENEKETKESISKDNENPSVRQKTEQELEDELLASTDSESNREDEYDLKVTLDDKELDFLDDDEEESENEGRFKSNSTSKPTKTPAVTSNFGSKTFDKSRGGGFNSNYKRRSYNDEPRRNKKRSRSSNHSSPAHKIRITKEKSPKPINKEPVQPAKIIIINKEKEKPKEKEEILFKATFKSIEAPADDKKKGGETKKDDRVRLIRGSVVSRVEKSTTSKEVETKRPAIMKRLGGYIKDTKKRSKSWAKEQAP